mmetsp:Transcript_24941/g.44897  ORF Transcript_24941/g.44897 Transcript_24941/m.44897 type:complete len:236 (+) Transcript_24941:103-810(+)
MGSPRRGLQFGDISFVLGHHVVQTFRVRSKTLGIVHLLGHFNLIGQQVVDPLPECSIFVLEVLTSLGNHLDLVKGGSGIGPLLQDSGIFTLQDSNRLQVVIRPTLGFRHARFRRRPLRFQSGQLGLERCHLHFLLPHLRLPLLNFLPERLVFRLLYMKVGLPLIELRAHGLFLLLEARGNLGCRLECSLGGECIAFQVEHLSTIVVALFLVGFQLILFRAFGFRDVAGVALGNVQ